ncbi:hypothetical protein SAMN05518672_106203 [Chitinophaga sp. CF118]|nr:hypothetical protein SAMN05518672_106203 [Chitinophaga sp. CF118]
MNIVLRCEKTNFIFNDIGMDGQHALSEPLRPDYLQGNGPNL